MKEICNLTRDSRIKNAVDFLSFNDWFALKENESTDWMIVARLQKIGSSDFRTFSVLASAEEGNLEKFLSTEDWDIMRLGNMDFGRPYFELSKEDDLIYDSGQSAKIEGIEFQPFTLYHTYHGYIPHRFELVQNFLLFNDAFYDKREQKYVRINDDGELDPVAKYESINEDNLSILVDVHLLRDFLAANRSYLIRYHDHRRWTKEDITEQINERKFKKIPISSPSSRFELLLRTELQWGDNKSNSRLLGKDIVYPYPEPNRQHKDHLTGQFDSEYAKFIIGRDEKEEEIHASCNEEILGNRFNGREPRFLTPVFFAKELLVKYKSEPSRYQVGKSYISCLDLWSIEIRITEEDLIHAWLGDLGRIPYNEQVYWQEFNMAPGEGFTRARLIRNFAGKIVESTHELESRDTALSRVIPDFEGGPTYATPEAELGDDFIENPLVLKAIRIVLSTGHEMERLADTYNDMKETDLRAVLLTSLNANFESVATGETISRKGKTDIYIPLSGSHPLIFECKIWDGPKKYEEAIEQLFRYLAWRDREAGIITFCKRVHFTSILETARAAIRNNQTYVTGSLNCNDSSRTHIIAHHKNPSDPQRYTKIHHIFFNLKI